MKKPPLRSFRCENFKAIRDSGQVNFGWLTVFIGNNGTGKSSLIEAMETFRDIVTDGVDAAFRRWRGFENVLNKNCHRQVQESVGSRTCYDNPLRFRFDWRTDNSKYKGNQSITQGNQGNSLFITHEELTNVSNGKSLTWERNDSGKIYFGKTHGDYSLTKLMGLNVLGDGGSMMNILSDGLFDQWQFLMLNPEYMGQPSPQQLAATVIELMRDGSNLAEYINDMRQKDIDVYDSFLRLSNLSYHMQMTCVQTLRQNSSALIISNSINAILRCAEIVIGRSL